METLFLTPGLSGGVLTVAMQLYIETKYGRIVLKGCVGGCALFCFIVSVSDKTTSFQIEFSNNVFSHILIPTRTY